MTPVLTTPTYSNVLPKIDAQVFLGGVRRTDCYALTSDTSGATIIFPAANYDSNMTLENTLVEIKVPPYGLIFRGYITRRGVAATGGVAYFAMDYLTKFQDQHFVDNYRFLDSVDGTTIKNNLTIREIANVGYSLYLEWQSDTTPNDFLLSIDLQSFPLIFPDLGTATLRGSNLLEGLDSLLKQIDFRYAIKVTHYETRSVVSAYILGSGNKRKIVRGTDPSLPAGSQPHGPANVLSVNRNVNSANTISHIYAEGDNRKVEKSFDLTENYPTGNQSEILNNYDKYTNEESPSYLQINERVARYYSLPTIVDHNDTSARVLLESTLVQTWQGFEEKPFIVYQKVGDATYYVQRDGFSISNNQEVIFDEPFCDSLNHVMFEGNQIDSYDYNSGDNTTDVEISDSDLPAVEDINAAISADSLWMFFGEKMAYYQVTGYSEDSEFTIQGRIDSGYEVTSYMLVTEKFVPLDADEGEGAINGRYAIDPGDDDTIFTDEYAGFYLVLGSKDGSGNYEVNIEDIEYYRIRANTAAYLYLDTTETVVGASSEYSIVNPRFDTKQPFTFIALNAAYRSSEKLQSTVVAPTVLANKRIVYKSNTNFIWTSQVNNFQIDPAGNGNTATAHVGSSDTINNTAALEVWAAYLLAGINNYEISYDVALPTFQVDINVGDQLVDNEFDAGVTVTSRSIDYKTGVISISARSF